MKIGILISSITQSIPYITYLVSHGYDVFPILLYGNLNCIYKTNSELKNLIEAGHIDRTIFSHKQLQNIYDGDVRIHNLTWHHHEDIGRIQLISRDVHKSIGHFGGFDLWFK